MRHHVVDSEEILPLEVVAKIAKYKVRSPTAQCFYALAADAHTKVVQERLQSGNIFHADLQKARALESDRDIALDTLYFYWESDLEDDAEEDPVSYDPYQACSRLQYADC